MNPEWKNKALLFSHYKKLVINLLCIWEALLSREVPPDVDNRVVLQEVGSQFGFVPLSPHFSSDPHTWSSAWSPGGALGLDVGSCSSRVGTALLPAVSACERYSEEPYCFLLELETKFLLSSCGKENRRTGTRCLWPWVPQP